MNRFVQGARWCGSPILRGEQIAKALGHALEQPFLSQERSRSGAAWRALALGHRPSLGAESEVFAVVFAGRYVPMRSNAVGECQCRSIKRGARTGPLVFSVRCSHD